MMLPKKEQEKLAQRDEPPKTISKDETPKPEEQPKPELEEENFADFLDMNYG